MARISYLGSIPIYYEDSALSRFQLSNVRTGDDSASLRLMGLLQQIMPKPKPGMVVKPEVHLSTLDSFTEVPGRKPFLLVDGRFFRVSSQSRLEPERTVMYNIQLVAIRQLLEGGD